MTALLPVHIAAGGIAILTGAAALLVRKGARVHRASGLVFVYAMVVMGLTGSTLAARKGFNPNLLGGFTSAYFVITGLFTMRTASRWSRPVLVGGLFVALVLGLVEATVGGSVLAAGRLTVAGVPVPMLMFLAGVTLAAAAGDLRVLRGRRLRAPQRLRRHLWRMCFALFIAAGSFFSIRARVARVLPAVFLSGFARTLPILLVFVAMFYWSWAVGRRSADRFERAPGRRPDHQPAR